MENYFTQITDYLLAQSWQIAVLVVIIAAVTLALRNRSAHIRYLLWLIVLAKCLVPPLLTVPLAIMPEGRAVIAFTPTEPIDTEPIEASTATMPVPSDTAVEKHAPRFTIHQWLAAGWIAVASMFVLAAVTKALRTEFWLRQQRKPLPVKLKSEIEDLFSCFKIRTLPGGWLVEGIGQPFVWGLLRGGIYLPANFVKANSAEHRRGVIGHELSHILRFDAAINFLQVIAQAIFWFHPFVWLANKKIRAEREKCCDEMAIAHLGAKVKEYSSAIVNILICEHESTRPVPSLAVAGPVKNIEERIKTMLKPGKKFYKHPSLVAATVALLIALVTIPTALVLTARGQAQPPIQSVASEKPEQSRYAARTFNSKAEFEVFVQETSGDDPRSIGHTPSAVPLEIPACWLWWVQPSVPLRDWNLVVREISENKVPGLKLFPAVDADLRYLVGLTELRYLDLDRTQITDAGMAHLQSLTGLEALRLDITRITDVGLEHLKGLTGLQRLNLMYTRVTDAGLEYLKDLTGLQHLDLVQDRITDAGLAHLKGLSGLRELRLSGTPITDEGLAHLKGLTRLRALNLYGTKITSAGMKYLEGMKELQELQLHDTEITDAGLEHLKGLTRLQELNLMNTWIGDAGLAHLKGLTGLHWLWLSTPGITDSGLAHLECLTELQGLSLKSMQITDAGLTHLKGLTKLQGLWISAPRVTDAGLAYLEAMRGAEWRSLGLENTQITDAGLECLRELTGLQELDLGGTRIGDAGLEHLKGLTGMQRLYLSNTQITDAGLECLRGLTGLQELRLFDTQITDAGLAHLKDLVGLQELLLDNSRITDAGVAHLKGLIRLQALWLDGTQITDAGLAHLKGLNGLKLLRLKETNVTDAGIQQLKQSLPKLTIVR